MELEELKQIKRSLEHLTKVAKTLHKLAENECNFGLSKSQETRQNNLIEEAEQDAQSLGFRLVYGGDPRGAMFALTSEEDKSYYEITDGIYF